MKDVELLAPIGNFECLKYAIEAKADAVYLAGKNFGARAYADNFTDEELVEAIDLCHKYNILCYVTVNTLIFENEIEKCVKYLDFLYEASVDAIICQDLGLASIIKHRYPGLKLHASTQINANTVRDCENLKKLGFDRVVLAREVSIDTIKEIRKNVDIELEVFVHGAICISYSGCCYFSSFISNRSGNRGRCTQPCRLIHSVDNVKKYFLSPKDLCTLDYINEISPYVDSLKIEGRMKSKDYVYSVIKAYNDVLNNKDVKLDDLKYDIMMQFNRDFTKGFINNAPNKDITNVLSSNHQGVLIGKVVSYSKDKTTILLDKELYDTDSIRIVSKNSEDPIEIHGMYNKSNLVKKGFPNDFITVRGHREVYKGDLVYLTKRDLNLECNRKVNIALDLSNDDNYLYVKYYDNYNSVKKRIPYETANNDLNARLIEQLSKTGDTPFKVCKVNNNLSKNIYINIKDINALRRNALLDLIDKKIYKYSDREINNSYPNLKINDIPSDSKISFLVSDNKQKDEVNEFLNENNIDLLDGYRIYSRYDKNDIYYLPRVNDIKAGFNSVSSSLTNITNYSSIYYNCTNSFTVRVLEHLGYNVIGLSIELSYDNIKDLINGYYNRYKRYPNVEVMIYGHIQLMYMKHCFLNKYKEHDKMNCGECKNYRIDDMPLFKDSLCHLSILSKDPIYLLNKTRKLKSIHVNNFLIDFTIEKDCKNILEEIIYPKEDGYFGHFLKELL